MPDVLVKLTDRILTATNILVNSIITPGKTMDHSHRDHGDENDFDVVTNGLCRQVNQKPSRTEIEPVMAVAPNDRVVAVLKRGVEIGDFEINADGSIQPVVPHRGEVNHTWVQVLMGEMMIAIGRDPSDPAMIDVPRKIADLIRDMVE